MKLSLHAALALACVAAPSGAFESKSSVHLAPAQTPPKPIPASHPGTKLVVGAQAPALSVDRWVQGAPVAQLEKGKVYLILFWATWSKASIEQLDLAAQIAQKHGEKGLVTLAIASADLPGTTLEKVQLVLAEKGDAIRFPVAWDHDTKTKDAFLKSAGRTAVPCCVLVDANGKIAFLESATRVGWVLESVLAGTHDLEAIAAWHAKAERAPQTMKQLQAAQQAGKHAEIVALVDELLEVDSVEYARQVQARMEAEAIGLGSPEKSLAWCRSFVGGPAWNCADGLNVVAWTMVAPQRPFPGRDVNLAQKAADRAVELTQGENGAVLDTQARVHFLKGDVVRAIDVQRTAIEKVKPNQPELLAQLKATLKEYEDALATK